MDDIAETLKDWNIIQMTFLYMNYTSQAITGKLELDLDCFQVNFGHCVKLTIKSVLLEAIIQVQVVNGDLLKCKCCVIIFNEGEKINLPSPLWILILSRESEWMLTDWPDLVSSNEPVWKFPHDATSCHPRCQKTLNMPVPGVDKFITAMSQRELCRHDLVRFQSQRQMAIKDNHVTVCSLA